MHHRISFEYNLITLFLLLFTAFTYPSISGQEKKANKNNSEVKALPPMYYEMKIELLNHNSAIKLDYNADVQKYIDLYLTQRKEKIAEFLELSQYYFPIFDRYLDKYQLPFELKYLAILESNLDPAARSSSGALGLWQLLADASKLLGLEVSSYVDQRCDVYASTDAACRYLKYLYSVFNDWQLALAAYNGGPGEIKKAIERSGGKTTFWEIQPYLPEQTKWYVPAFIAIVYLYNQAADHGIYAAKTGFGSISTDTLQIMQALEFDKLSEKIGMSIDSIRKYNPCYRRDYIPMREKGLTLVLPSDKVLAFLKRENQIYSQTNDTLDMFQKMEASSNTQGMVKTFYEVKKGDFLHKIALANGCTADNIMIWNKLKSQNLKVGQQLIIWKKDNTKNKKDNYFEYTVKKGDTIWGIAQRYKCDSINDIMLINNLHSEQSLIPGSIIRIRIR
ncbi:MAG TPA: LysM peptidoglycan-binding domain-containing protein [Bacteroidales bacterium]|mgnify:CR=1 FL=1|nr:LysM peptidoglycan-binding domain-containing protein [Bacteroidales bacterium]